MPRGLADYCRVIAERLENDRSAVMTSEERFGLIGEPRSVLDALESRRRYARVIKFEAAHIRSGARPDQWLKGLLATSRRNGTTGEALRTGLVPGVWRTIVRYCRDGFTVMLDYTSLAEPRLVISWQKRQGFEDYRQIVAARCGGEARVALLHRVPEDYGTPPLFDDDGDAMPSASSKRRSGRGGTEMGDLTRLVKDPEGLPPIPSPDHPVERPATGPMTPMTNGSGDSVPPVTLQINPNQRQIMEFACQRLTPGGEAQVLDRGEVAAHVGVARTSLMPMFDGLVKHGLLIEVGRGRGLKYRLGPLTTVRVVSRGAIVDDGLDLNTLLPSGESASQDEPSSDPSPEPLETPPNATVDQATGLESGLGQVATLVDLLGSLQRALQRLDARQTEEAGAQARAASARRALAEAYEADARWNEAATAAAQARAEQSRVVAELTAQLETLLTSPVPALALRLGAVRTQDLDRRLVAMLATEPKTEG